MAKKYVPLGMNPETGDYEGPLDGDSQRMEGASALAWHKKQRYFFDNGRVRRVVPQKDKHGLRNSWVEAPANAPVFNYETADSIRREMHGGTKPIDALLKFIPATKLNPQWLEANGAPASMIPHSKVYATAKALEALENAGILTEENRAKILAANGVSENEITSAPILDAAQTKGIEVETDDEDPEAEVDAGLYEDDVEELETIES